MGNCLVPNLCLLIRRRNPIYPLTTPTWVGEPHNTSKQTLRISWKRSCDSSWRSSAGRLHSESWTHPQKPTTNTLGESYGKWGSWYGWLGSHLSERGWVPPDQPFWPPAPAQPDGGWEPRGQSPHPPASVQPDEDVGCLINSLAIQLWLGTPQINTFSIDAMPGKTEVSFEQWYCKVHCVKDHYPESVVWESIVHSLKGAAVDMATYIWALLLVQPTFCKNWPLYLAK